MWDDMPEYDLDDDDFGSDVCPECQGRGVVLDENTGSHRRWYVECPECNGSGEA